MRKIVINDIGKISHEDADDLMRVMQAKRIEDEILDTLIICEHDEIVTIGPRARNDGIKPPEDYATSAVDRGGGLTWHGPGQIVVYPIFKWDLEGESNVKAIISILEEWVIKALLVHGISASRDERMQGVWIGENKICSIGLSFLRWTSRHGLTINYDTPLGRVETVSGCGLGKDTTTSLSTLGFNLTRKQILNSLIENVHILSREIYSE
ncbi:MAG: lipoyl(octanoyl) transferase [Euryarchaeota archaeon]|nr:lipoyl(octanoyl) transferase [Euryarchaeota archaeon]|tara:strand:- start:87 stop:716 length:630 start_codon:yes stop_codon:yes gene_type:complete